MLFTERYEKKDQKINYIMIFFFCEIETFMHIKQLPDAHKWSRMI